MGFRRHALASLLFALWCCRIACSAADAAHATAQWQDGRSAVVAGLTLAEIRGQPADLGDQMGHLFAKQVRAMLAGTGAHAETVRLKQLAAGIPDDYRHELDALAKAAQVDAQELTRANLMVDTMCSAAVHLGDPARRQPLVLGRNLDFSPADLLGDGTVVTILRPAGKHAVAAIGWPGFTGIVSGMNDAGVAACVLLNLHQHSVPPEAGAPLAYRVRAMLESAGGLEEAVALFAASAVASDNFVLVADAAGATVVWQDHGQTKRFAPRDGWLFCTNSPMVERLAGPDDARGRCLRSLAAEAVDPDAAWMRRALGAAYLTDLNAQAMVFVPAQRRLQLATGRSLRPAALSVWRDLDLAPLFAGGSVSEATVVELGKVANPLPHYR